MSVVALKVNEHIKQTDKIEITIISAKRSLRGHQVRVVCLPFYLTRIATLWKHQKLSKHLDQRKLSSTVIRKSLKTDGLKEIKSYVLGVIFYFIIIFIYIYISCLCSFGTRRPTCYIYKYKLTLCDKPVGDKPTNGQVVSSVCGIELRI